MSNEPVDLIPVPSGLSAYLLLIPLRGQEECRKQAGIGHWGRSAEYMKTFLLFLRFFIKTGLWCSGIVTLSALAINLFGIKSPLSMVFLPVFMLLFQVPYILLALLTEGTGIGRAIFYGSPWLMIPFWLVIIFCWNGVIGGFLALIWNYLQKLQKAEPSHSANPRNAGG